MKKIKCKLKSKLTSKVDQFKKWVYKHYVGVYMAIGIAICTVCFLLGLGYGATL